MKLINVINILIYSFFLIAVANLIFLSNGNLMILSYITLGIVQPILALILVVYQFYKKASNNQLICGYWVSVFTFFILVGLISFLDIDNEIIIKTLGIIPTVIATYFVYVTYKIQKNIL